MAEPVRSPISPQDSKMADADFQNGHVTTNVNNCWSPAANGDHSDTSALLAKQLPAEPLLDFGGSGFAPEVMSQLAEAPSEAVALLGGAVVDMEPVDTIQEASTASLTPTSPPPDGLMTGFDNGGFDADLPEAASSISCGQDEVTTLFGNTGCTLADLGVQEAPPPDHVATTPPGASNGQHTKPEMTVTPEPEVVPQHQNGAEVAAPQSPASPSKKSRESKLPKMTPPASPKKKPSEAPPPPPDEENDDKLFHKVALPPEAHMQTEPSGGARPKSAPSKQQKPVVDEARPGSAPLSKIPSPKKERTQERAQEHTPVSTPKKQDVASDSGIEEDRTASPRSRTPASTEKKRYGIDSKNAMYKPAGGNVKIFEKKMDVKSVGARIDNKPTPKKADGSPRTRPGAYTPEIPRSKKITETIKTMTPSPNTKAAASRIGSLANTKHTPGGGNVKILSKKEDFSTIQSKCGSTVNMKHTPGGGGKKIEHQKLEWQVGSRVGSLDNARHKPGGGEKKIQSQKLEWNVTSRVGSLEKADHKPGGGAKKIEQRKLEWNVTSKVGSLDKTTHKPGGGDKKIESQKLNWNVQSKVGSLDNATHKAAGGDKKIETHKVDFRDKATSKVGSTKNLKHKPGGGDKMIETEKLTWNAQSKVGSLDNATHKPSGGDKKIEQHKVDFRDKAHAKVGSTKNMDHIPQGGDKMIETHKVDFRDKATARTNHGVSPAKIATAAANST